MLCSIRIFGVLFFTVFLCFCDSYIDCLVCGTAGWKSKVPSGIIKFPPSLIITCSLFIFMRKATRNGGFRPLYWTWHTDSRWNNTVAGSKKVHIWECHRWFGGKLYFEVTFLTFTIHGWLALEFWLFRQRITKRPCKSLRLGSLSVLSLPNVSFLMNSDSVNSCFSLGHLPLPPPFSCEKWAFACSENGCNTGTSAGRGNPSWISSQCWWEPDCWSASWECA